jgi:hypothetical protein
MAKKKQQWKKRKKSAKTLDAAPAAESKPATEKEKDKKNIGGIAAMDAVDDFDRFEDFFTTNLKLILTSFAVAALIILAAAVAYSFLSQKRAEVAAKILDAKTISEIEKAIKEHPENQAVPLAKLRLATLKFKAGDKQAALDIYSELAATAPPGEPKDRAALNKAYTLESMDKIDEAIQEFKQIGEDPSHPEYIRNEALYSAARLLLSKGDKQAAKDVLKSIDFSHQGFWTAQGERLLQRTN